MKKIFCSILILNTVFVGQNLLAQSNNTDWNLISLEKGVKLQSRLTHCDDKFENIHQDEIHLQFINLNTVPVVVTYEYQFELNGKCHNCGVTAEREYKKSIELKPLETISGNCDLNTQSNLKLVSKLNDGTSLGSGVANFKVKNITVNTTTK